MNVFLYIFIKFILKVYGIEEVWYEVNILVVSIWRGKGSIVKYENLVLDVI